MNWEVQSRGNWREHVHFSKALQCPGTHTTASITTNRLSVMSTLWTPSGEWPVGGREQSTTPKGAPGSDNHTSPPPYNDDHSTDHIDTQEQYDTTNTEAEVKAQGDQDEAQKKLIEQIANTPANLIIANHCYGLIELAAIHLSQSPPKLQEARLAIDASVALIQSLEGRLGEQEGSLKTALRDIQYAFVKASGQ